MAIVRKDKLLAGYNGNLESVKIHNSTGAKVASTNGVFVVLDGYMEGQREVVKGVLADLNTADQEVLLIHNSEVMYDERLFKLEDFYIKADKVARAYRLYTGDIITLTEDLFVSKPTVGQKLIAHTDGKLGEDLTALATAKVVFEVFEDSGYELHPNMKAYAVKVVRN